MEFKRIPFIAVQRKFNLTDRQMYYIRELMKTWIMKGYSVEDVENGKR